MSDRTERFYGAASDDEGPEDQREEDAQSTDRTARIYRTATEDGGSGRAADAGGGSSDRTARIYRAATDETRSRERREARDESSSLTTRIYQAATGGRAAESAGRDDQGRGDGRRPDLREQADVEPGRRRDLREADRQGAAATSGGRDGALAAKIREFRKKIARRRAQQQSKQLQRDRDRRERRRPVREAKREVGRLREEAAKLRDTGTLGRVLGAARKLGAATGAGAGAGAATGAGARGRPGTREDDPAVRAGETAMAGAPVDATLDPFGGPRRPEGPMQLEVMAGGGPAEVREARRRARGDAHLEEFAAAGGIDADATAEPRGGADVYKGNPMAVDTDPLFDTDGDPDDPLLAADALVTGDPFREGMR